MKLSASASAWRLALTSDSMIKEHTTIQSRAAADLAAERRTCLTGTPLQNQLDDLFSLVRFLRLEPFTDRGIWTAYIGGPAKLGQALGVSRLQLVMRHLALRRTKATKDADGKPILNLPPRKDEMVYLELDEREKAFYAAHHGRYRSNFLRLEQTDTLLKNYCSILQELLRLRQICVHMELVRSAAGADDVIEAIRRDGISKQRALQLLALMRDADEAQCNVCSAELAPSVMSVAEADEGAMVQANGGPPAKKARGKGKGKAAAATEACVGDDPTAPAVVTRCQHLFCLACFQRHVCASFPATVTADTRVECTCREVITPIVEAVTVRAGELDAIGLGDATDGTDAAGPSSASGKAKRVVEHSTKIRALMSDLLPFSQANPASANYAPDEAELAMPNEDDMYRPHRGEVVKTVVFSQWTKLLERIEDALDECQIGYRKLDGSMNRNERTRSMDKFRTDPACEILLVSLRAGACLCWCAVLIAEGGVGLNLTTAQRVYLMEVCRAWRDDHADGCSRFGILQSRRKRSIASIVSARPDPSRLSALSSRTASRRRCSSSSSALRATCATCVRHHRWRTLRRAQLRHVLTLPQTQAGAREHVPRRDTQQSRARETPRRRSAHPAHLICSRFAAFVPCTT